MAVMVLRRILGVAAASLVGLSAFVLFIPFAHATTTYTLYESIGMTTGDGDSTTIYGANQTAEAFTPTSGHSVVLVNLMLKRVGAAPGTVTVAITEASGNVSTGVPVISATLDGALLSTSYTKIPVNFTETTLENGQQYAISVSAVSGDASNYVLWQKNTAGTAHLSSNSTDGGASWTTTVSDQLFEIWGNPSLKVVSANVFSDYLATGDLLICMEHWNTYAPYYGVTIPQEYFLVQFVSTDNSTVLASTPMTGWGDRPEAMYLSPASATGITQGGAYFVRMVCLDSSSANTSYQLQGADWKGANLVYLDKWMIATAHNMESYYSTTYVDYITGTGEVLNAAGGAIFTNAISGIMNVRPNVFEYAESKPTWPPPTGSQGQSVNAIDAGSFLVAVGSTVYNDMSAIADIFGVSAVNMAGYLIGAVIIGLVLFAIGGAPSGYEAMGAGALSVLLVAGVPLLLMGAYIHAISAQMVAVLAFIMGFVFVLKFWAARI